MAVTPRLATDAERARRQFENVELRYANGVYLKAALQTSAGHQYVIKVSVAHYPSLAPDVHVTAPRLRPGCPHKYSDTQICYLHPSAWNPGRHDLAFVLARAAKWLNKYEVWRTRGYWPGAEVGH